MKLQQVAQDFKRRSQEQVARANQTSPSNSVSHCPDSLARWYCLNGATCFSVLVDDNSILYNCWCRDGFHGARCDYKYTTTRRSEPEVPSRPLRVVVSQEEPEVESSKSRLNGETSPRGEFDINDSVGGPFSDHIAALGFSSEFAAAAAANTKREIGGTSQTNLTGVSGGGRHTTAANSFGPDAFSLTHSAVFYCFLFFLLVITFCLLLIQRFFKKQSMLNSGREMNSKRTTTTMTASLSRPSAPAAANNFLQQRAHSHNANARRVEDERRSTGAPNEPNELMNRMNLIFSRDQRIQDPNDDFSAHASERWRQGATADNLTGQHTMMMISDFDEEFRPVKVQLQHKQQVDEAQIYRLKLQAAAKQQVAAAAIYGRRISGDMQHSTRTTGATAAAVSQNYNSARAALV